MKQLILLSTQVISILGILFMFLAGEEILMMLNMADLIVPALLHGPLNKQELMLEPIQIF